MAVISSIVKKSHNDLIVNVDGVKKYKILKDYSGTYIEKQIRSSSEEKMIYPIFRVFEAAKPERGRKLNVDPTHNFDPYVDSVMDYASIIGSKLKKPWQQYNRLIALQVPLCPNDCWHCYLPKELYVGVTKSERRYETLSAKDIVDRFLEQRDSHCCPVKIFKMLDNYLI